MSDEPDPLFLKMRLARLRAGLTQQQVADAIGCKRWVISALECGRLDPRMSFLRRYFLVVGAVHTYRILDIEEEK